MKSIWPEAPPASHNDIVNEAHGIFLAYNKEVGSQHILENGINFNEIYDTVIYPRTEVQLDVSRDLGCDEKDDLILGQFDPYGNVACVNKQLVDDDDPRLIFTLNHEVGGHGVLHGPYLRKNERNHPILNTTVNTIQNEMMMPFERQANTFAANLAAPIPFIRLLCKLHFGLSDEQSFVYTRPCSYNLNFMGSCERVYIHNKNHLARIIAKKIRRFFGGLSTEALSYQVEKAVIEDRSCCVTDGYDGTYTDDDYSLMGLDEFIGRYYQ